MPNYHQMGEKSPRRMPISFSAEQLDYKESLARNENKRVRNRYELKEGTISGHKNTKLSSMNYEMRRLKHELRGIKETSGYFLLNHESSSAEDQSKIVKRSQTRTKTRVDKKKNKLCYPDSNEKSERSYSKANAALPSLPKLSPTKEKCTSKSNELSNSQTFTDRSNVNTSLDTRTAKCNNQTPQLSNGSSCNSIVEISVTSMENEETETKNNTDSESPKSDIFGLNVDAARGRIQNRLTGKPISDQDSDLTPYMHVPPDGLPRTVYLLPPLEDLLAEAKKARYIRKLRKPNEVLEDDDLERELDIDEIFSKQK